jgi:hypothetical protein
METNGTKNKRKGLLITASVAAILLIYYTVISSFGPSERMAMIIDEFGVAEDVSEVKRKIYNDTVYLSLLKDKSYLQAKNMMAKTDSVYLAINLADSTAALEISGVTVHSAKISSYSISSILSRGDRYSIYKLFSQPLTIENSVSTIKKEPVMIKIAPKDTSEYQPDVIPDTSLVEHVSFIIGVSNGIKIYVYQEEHDKLAERGSTFMFDITERLSSAWYSVRSAAMFRVPGYQPFIRIKIPREDVKILYRALPRNGQVAVYT